jgi:short-subunit dehydrogenase
VSIPYRAAYAAAKHALHGFFDCMRPEIDQYNVKVTLICPGYVAQSEGGC